MKKILVTGGAGFIGSHLCEKLLNNKNEVLCLDNYFTGSKANIIHLIENPYFEVIRHDITQPFYAEVDEIYNLASPASPIHYQYNSIKTIKTSVLGSINMLGLAKRVRAKILQASTSEVYGDPEIHPQKEDYWGHVNPIGKRSSYNEGKRCAESLFINYREQNNLNIRIARIFNTYGPRMALNDGRVISNFILQALRNDPITIYGKGNQTRGFQYVDDLVDALIQLMESDDKYYFPVNIGNPKELTMMELAKSVIDLTGSKSKIIYKPLPEDDPVKRQPDISLIKSIIGWEPTIGLKSGLRETIQYFKNELKL
jgi:UDP-glucuronate decarboxylase